MEEVKISFLNCIYSVSITKTRIESNCALLPILYEYYIINNLRFSVKKSIEPLSYLLGMLIKVKCFTDFILYIKVRHFLRSVINKIII